MPLPSLPGARYRLLTELGGGGTGTVYRARDLQLDRDVAVKVLRADLLADAGALERFRRETEILASLRHPSVAARIDAGPMPDGGAYLVMELVPGVTLRRLLQAEGRLEASAALPILNAVSGAVEAAHRQGIVHGDLKPENIMVPDDGTEARVLDFGVAVVAGREPRRRTAAGIGAPGTAAGGPIFGTPAYMAPEQLRGETPDARTDVFALGVLACEMLTGELPFGRGSAAEVVLAQARGTPALLRAMPAPLARAMQSAMEPNPDRRPPSAQAFAHLLGAASVL